MFMTTHYMEEAEHCDRIADHRPRNDRRARHAGKPEAAGRRRHHHGAHADNARAAARLRPPKALTSPAGRLTGS